jgi:hypothetical protein
LLFSRGERLRSIAKKSRNCRPPCDCDWCVSGNPKHPDGPAFSASAGNAAIALLLTPEDRIQEVNMAMEDRETFSLIGSDKVEGTNVYDPDGQKIGYIERVMIDKISGKVSYAVLSFGGLLGIGDDHYPLPWQTLKYDTNLGGYVTGITQDQLRGAPKYADESSWNWSDPATARSVNAYYGLPGA